MEPDGKLARCHRDHSALRVRGPAAVERAQGSGLRPFYWSPLFWRPLRTAKSRSVWPASMATWTNTSSRVKLSVTIHLASVAAVRWSDVLVSTLAPALRSASTPARCLLLDARISAVLPCRSRLSGSAPADNSLESNFRSILNAATMRAVCPSWSASSAFAPTLSSASSAAESPRLAASTIAGVSLNASLETLVPSVSLFDNTSCHLSSTSVRRGSWRSRCVTTAGTPVDWLSHGPALYTPEHRPAMTHQSPLFPANHGPVLVHDCTQ